MHIFYGKFYDPFRINDTKNISAEIVKQGTQSPCSMEATDPEINFVPVSAMKFEPVDDGRGYRIPCLWKRGDRYYAQLRVTNPVTGKRIPKKLALDSGITTVPQAKKALAEMQRMEAKGELTARGQVPTFGEFKDYYLANTRKATNTLANEKSYLDEWENRFGADTKLDKITEVAIRLHLTHLESAKNERTGQNLSKHSLNVRVYALRSMLRMAKDERRITRLPFDGIKKIKHKSAKKKIPPIEDIEKIVNSAIEHCPKSGKAFADYLRLLMFSGARETEALSLRWSDIYFDRKQVHFHRNTKFGKERWLDFNPKLEALLKDMHERRKKDLKPDEHPWLFPSPRPNLQGGRIINYRQTLEKVRRKVGVHLSEHYLRHYFTSQCVMAGVDRFVLVKWLGHADGGKLIAETYGHLSNAFEQKQANKLTNL